MDDKDIIRMSNAIQAYLEKYQQYDVKPKDLMPYLMEKRFFGHDNKNGNPLRKILRKLDSEKRLHLLPQIRVERSNARRFWFFNPVKF